MRKLPALSRCLLVDASFRSRKLIVGSLKASTMFEEIVEGKSLNDGLEQLAMRPFDALFLGPSLQIERSDAFFGQAKRVSLAKDCAFVSIFRDTLEGSTLVENSIAHVTVSDKATKRLFTESIVRAVLLACDESPWPGVRLDGDGNLMVSEKGVWRKVGGKIEAISPEARDPQSPDLSSLLTPKVLETLANACGERVEAETPEELSRLLGKILVSDGVGDSSVDDPLSVATRRVVQEWALDKDYMGIKEASKVLKRKLLELQKGELQKETPS